MKVSRHWAMPSADTFSIPPILGFVQSYLVGARVSIDPFARNSRLATHRNDLNPETAAEHHLDAEVFLKQMGQQGIRCDLGILDMPYSPRQISECYQAAGLSVGMSETQNAALYARTKAALLGVLTAEAIVLSFGWNSAGMGKKHGFEIIEIMLVCHGGAHNDTICLAEQRIQPEDNAINQSDTVAGMIRNEVDPLEARCKLLEQTLTNAVACLEWCSELMLMEHDKPDTAADIDSDIADYKKVLKP